MTDLFVGIPEETIEKALNTIQRNLDGILIVSSIAVIWHREKAYVII